MPTVNEHKQRIDNLKSAIKQGVEKIVSTYIGKKVSKPLVDDIRTRASSHLVEKWVIGATVMFKLRITKTGIIKAIEPTVVGQPTIDPLLPQLVENLEKDGKLKAVIDHDGTIHYAWNNDCLMTGHGCGWQTQKPTDKEVDYQQQTYAAHTNMMEIENNPKTLKKRGAGLRKWFLAILVSLWTLLPRKRAKTHGGYVSKYKEKEIQRYRRYLVKTAHQGDWARLAGVTSDSKDKRRRWWMFLCPWKYDQAKKDMK
jgi:hypothetical protein